MDASTPTGSMATAWRGSSTARLVLRMAVLSPDQVVIEDTWHVCGMSGTGSHHIRVEEAFVPWERTFETLTVEPCLDAPVLRIPLLALYSTCMASVAVGNRSRRAR